MHLEKRNCARLDLHAKANIHLGDQDIMTDMENVSMKGAFVAAVSPLKLNDVVAFTIAWATLGFANGHFRSAAYSSGKG